MVLLLLGCACASAQSAALVGQWQNVQDTQDTDLNSRLTLGEAGLAHVELEGRFSQDFLRASTDENVQQLADLFPEGLQIRIVGDGTWTATPDSLTLRFPDPDLVINGDTFEAFILTIATSLAATVIERLSLPVSQEPSVIATFVELLQEDLSEQDVFDQAFGGGESEPTAYRMEANVLILIDADGTQARWHRLTASHAEVQSWGKLKSSRLK